MNDFALFTWTNTEYDDLFSVYFGNIKKYFNDLTKSYVAIDKLSDKISDDHIQLVNDENTTYCERIISCLEHIDEDYILYMQEDFILYDNVNFEEFLRCFEYLKNSNCSNIRLLRCGSDSLEIKKTENIYQSCKELSAVHQSLIWKKKDFIEIILNLNPKTIRDFEFNSNASRIMNNLGYESCFYFDKDSPRRKNSQHFDSKVFPYTATSIVAGKWNVCQYSDDIERFSKEYDINLNSRGFYYG
jgi:hypothetical protein